MRRHSQAAPLASAAPKLTRSSEQWAAAVRVIGARDAKAHTHARPLGPAARRSASAPGAPWGLQPGVQPGRSLCRAVHVRDRAAGVRPGRSRCRGAHGGAPAARRSARATCAHGCLQLHVRARLSHVRARLSHVRARLFAATRARTAVSGLLSAAVSRARTAVSSYTIATSRAQPLQGVIRTVNRNVTFNLIRFLVQIKLH